ncbi:MAG: hypothetical protein EZS28_018458 [Streblomastix strix]|uniref:Uncharacterized protein n=1 Tax=Streblomastix strix TaxID=222440 RepID=A0A5J4VV00_9EUKA|nr:MAG: hypothetical protein EZS28_018458 [Streblomastix strix]
MTFRDQGVEIGDKDDDDDEEEEDDDEEEEDDDDEEEDDVVVEDDEDDEEEEDEEDSLELSELSFFFLYFFFFLLFNLFLIVFFWGQDLDNISTLNEGCSGYGSVFKEEGDLIDFCIFQKVDYLREGISSFQGEEEVIVLDFDDNSVYL